MKLNTRRTLQLATTLSVAAFLIVVGKPLWQWHQQQSWQRAQKPSPNLPSPQDIIGIHRAVLFERASTFMPRPPPIAEADLVTETHGLEHAPSTIFVAEKTIQMDPDDDTYGCVWDASKEHPKQDLHLMESPPHSLFVELCLMNQQPHPIELSSLNQLPNASIYPKKHAMPFASWQTFGKDHPNSIGFVGLSQPVVSDGGLSALVYVVHDCGELCGQTAFYWLFKDEAGWRVEKVMLHTAS